MGFRSMFMKKKYYRLFIKGGVLSPGELKLIVMKLMEKGLEHISFGSRQDILFSTEIPLKDLHFSADISCVFPNQKEKENIVCSYLSTDILSTTPWLTGDRYLYILEQFKFHPKLKINIVDPLQRLVPLFSGQINFIASKHEDYWYLYLQMPNWESPELYPALIYSWDIATLSKTIENLIPEEFDSIETLFDVINDLVETNNRTIDSPLNNPFHPFPYYEGMNKMGTDKYWLGLYWRNNKYDLPFLLALCELCAESKIGKICITPWKSFIIKGIPGESKLRWEKYLGSQGINVRHSQLELNWHLPVGDRHALKLKNYLVTKLDQHDISTYGLTIGISERCSKVFHFTSIVIQRNPSVSDQHNLQLRTTYNLNYAKNFDPNTRIYRTYALEVDKMELPGLLMELSKQYFHTLGEGIEESAEQAITSKIQSPKPFTEVQIYQCTDCLTVYDQTYGDSSQNIPEKTPFEQLPETYRCSLCEAPKSNFSPIILPTTPTR